MHAWNERHSVQEYAMWGVRGMSPEDMSAVHIHLVDASSSLWFRECQVHQIRWILHAPNSAILALVSKYAIAATIEVGWSQHTLNWTRCTWRTQRPWRTRDINMVVSQTNTLGRTYGILTNGLILIALAYDSSEGSSLCLSFEHMSGDHVEPNCQWVEESCRIWTEDRVGTLVSGNCWSYMGSNWVRCC